MKYLLPPIARDVAMGIVVTEEQAIIRAQYLDLVYSQSKTLYGLIPQSPHPSIDPAKPPAEAPVDGVIGSIQTPSMVNLPSNPMLLLLLLLIL